jgi:hypothetical protein
LSLGRVTPDGYLQCGYHGWIFNGESGDIAGFPNLDEGERLPKCSIKTFPVVEQQGLVYFWSGEGEPDAEIPKLPVTTLEKAFHGRGVSPLGLEETVVALLDCPGVFLDFAGVDFTEKPLGDTHVRDGFLVADRAARWNWVGEKRFYMGPLNHRADFPILMRIQSLPITGQTVVRLYHGEERLMAELQLAFVPADRGMTSVSWKLCLDPAGYGRANPLVRVLDKLNVPLFNWQHKPDCNVLAAALPGPGDDWRELSQSDNPHPIARLVASV